MKLLTAAQRAKLIDNGRRQAAVKGTPSELDLWPVVKLFNPCGAATWLLTEIDPDEETIAWDLCDLGMGFPEFGTVSLEELAVYRGLFGLGIERDLHFKARAPISAYIKAASKAGIIVEDVGHDQGGAHAACSSLAAIFPPVSAGRSGKFLANENP
jgi:hypothetical protein